MANRSDLAIDPCRRLQGALHGEHIVQGNAKDGFILLEIGPDEGPVLDSERSKLTTVELVVGHLLLRVSQVNCPAGGEGEEIPAWVGGIEFADRTIVVEADAVSACCVLGAAAG